VGNFHIPELIERARYNIMQSERFITLFDLIYFLCIVVFLTVVLDVVVNAFKINVVSYF
jgi:hypothetical protein